MKKYIVPIITFILFSFVANAQQADTFQINGRLRDASWFRYSAGRRVASAVPIFQGITASYTSNRVLAYGARIQGGFFPVNKLYTGLSLQGGYIDYNFKQDGNIQMLQVHADYFFYDKSRVTPYAGISAGFMRYEYTSTVNEFFLKDIVGKRITHILPLAYLRAGASIKVRKHFTVQGGLVGCYRLYDHSVNAGSAGSPAYEPFGLWAGYLYHF